MISKFIEPDDSQWQAALSHISHDFYHLPEYCSLTAGYEGGKSLAFYTQEGNNRFLAPLLIKALPTKLHAGEDCRDATSPYGYSGPVATDSDNVEFLERSLQSLHDASAELGLVCAFFRLHPLLSLSGNSLSKYGTIRNIGRTVYIDLSIPKEALFSQMRKDHRANVRRLKKHGFLISIDDWGYYDDFIEIYRANMNRVRAGEFYLFSNEYFYKLKAALGDRIHLITVLSSDSQVAAAGLFTEIAGLVQYHLSATAEVFRKSAPMKLLLNETRDWAQASGYSCFHLGGGFGGYHDSLFQFKSGFSELTAGFNTFGMVFDLDKYNYLSNIWEQNTGKSPDESDFFPIYRTPL